MLRIRYNSYYTFVVRHKNLVPFFDKIQLFDLPWLILLLVALKNDNIICVDMYDQEPNVS